MERTSEVNPAAEKSLNDYEPSRIVRREHAEDDFTRVIEQQTAKIPSHVFLFAAMGLMAGSVALEIVGRSRISRTLAIWAPALLTMGVYNKLIKELGPR